MTGWLKKFTSVHDRLATEMNKCMQKIEITEWMTKGKTTLIQKAPRQKKPPPNHYRIITCLPIMWKILMAQIREIYYSLISRRIFPDEQIGCRKRTRGTEELLYILNESKTIGYKKVYDMFPQSWILHCLIMYEVSDQVIQFIEKTKETWWV